jgi:hypothetical protein
MKIFPTFKSVIEHAQESFKTLATEVHTETWQGVNISDKPEMATYELLNYSFSIPLQHEDLDKYRGDSQANIPWADNHFAERVSGYPLNPGTEWANWPYGKSADRFRDEHGQFNHTYAERYWPRYAQLVAPSRVPDLDYLIDVSQAKDSHSGIRYRYGDLGDIVNQLAREPNTRQAYLPVWFPEDTGVVHGDRVPCSLGYHFMHRHGYLHLSYFLRSCDFVRHFRDDIYLTVRLQLWLLDQLRKQDKRWDGVKPGIFTMHIMSFHIFKADYQPLFGVSR